jgi:hypothetical protein
VNGRPARTPRWLGPGSLAAAGLLFFGPYAARAGIHLDDHALLWTLSHCDAAGLWRATVQYVAGRNLYIPLFYALDRLCGNSAPVMHLVGLALDLLNPILLFALARRLGATRGQALAAGGIFLVYPNHGETHWWTCSIQMNLLTTSLALGAFLAASERRLGRTARLLLAAALFAVALFDYDQVFFLWIPLTALAFWVDSERRARPVAAAAAGFFLMNVVHFSLRMFSPYSSGGRPVPHFDVFLHSLRNAVAQTLAPMRRPPHLAGVPGGWPVALLLALPAAAAWAALCAREWGDEESPASGSAPLIVFGAAWWLFAYVPNFFWYISPRHNYLPSAGTALAAAGVAGLLSRRKNARLPLTALGAAFFVLSGLCAWSGGADWAASTTLHQRFTAEALPALPPRADSVFLVGAPKDVRTAPGFFQPHEHLYDLARASGRPPLAGGISIAPDRLGLFYGTQPDLFGPEVAPRFAEGTRAAVFAMRGDGRFERVCRVRLSSPGLAPRVLPVGGSPCPAVLAVEAPVALIDARVRAGSGPAPRDPALASASLAAGPGGARDLALSWKTGRTPAVDFAFYPILLDASGRELYRPIYAPSRREHEMLWPFFDDVLPPSRWPPGRTVVERYRLRPRDRDLGSAARVRLVMFRRREGLPWLPAGAQEVPLTP